MNYIWREHINHEWFLDNLYDENCLLVSAWLSIDIIVLPIICNKLKWTHVHVELYWCYVTHGSTNLQKNTPLINVHVHVA